MSLCQIMHEGCRWVQAVILDTQLNYKRLNFTDSSPNEEFQFTFSYQKVMIYNLILSYRYLVGNVMDDDSKEDFKLKPADI